VFAEVRSAVATLKQLARELEPLHFDGPGAASLLQEVAEGERVCAAMKALLARRVDECGAWRSSGHKDAAHWLADATGVAVPAATHVLETAHDLDALPATDEAFRAGEISEVQAHTITEAARMDPSAERELLATAAQQSTVKGLRDVARRVRAAAQPDDAAWARDMHLRRSHRTWTDRDGIYCGQYRLPPDDGAKFGTAIRDHQDRIFKAARKVGHRERYDAYGADALIALAEQGPCKPIQLKGSFAIEALERGHAERGEDVRIDGFGPIPVTIARRLAVDSVVTVITTKGDDIHSVSSAKRTVPARIRKALEQRDQQCSNPSCSNDQFLEMDHVAEFAAGGPTELDNLALFCPTCHDLKTYFGWRLLGPPGNRRFVPPDPGPGERVLELIRAGPP
jgi:Domain of unknown function (DUF222)/HNH endonuclease